MKEYCNLCKKVIIGNSYRIRTNDNQGNKYVSHPKCYKKRERVIW